MENCSGLIGTPKEAAVKTRVLLVCALAIGFPGSAMAVDYYVVQNPTTHRCTVTTIKPVDKEVVTEIGPIGFTSREEANGRIKQTKICHDETTGESADHRWPSRTPARIDRGTPARPRLFTE